MKPLLVVLCFVCACGANQRDAAVQRDSAVQRDPELQRQIEALRPRLDELAIAELKDAKNDDQRRLAIARYAQRRQEEASRYGRMAREAAEEAKNTRADVTNLQKELDEKQAEIDRAILDLEAAKDSEARERAREQLERKTKEQREIRAGSPKRREETGTSGPKVPGDAPPRLTKKQIQTTMRQGMREFRKCSVHGSGFVRVKLEVAASGLVTSAVPLINDRVSNCVGDVMKSLHFPSAKMSTTFTFPVRL
jgi:hypothetical protein